MDWGTFFTIIAQVGITLIAAFFIGAILVACVKAVRDMDR